MKHGILPAAIAAATMAFDASVAAADWRPSTVVLRSAYGNDALDVGVHARWPLDIVEWLPGRPSGFAEAGFDYWHSTIDDNGPQDLVNVSAMVGLRWHATPAWFFDVSGGPYLLSRTQLADRRFGIALQFGARFASGIAFGEGRRHEVAAYFEHTSNARLAQPNQGMSFYGVEYRYALR
jgi:lipid A 3-O-deacylase